MEFNFYVFGWIMFKGRDSNILFLLNVLRVEGEVGFCDIILEVEGC